MALRDHVLRKKPAAHAAASDSPTPTTTPAELALEKAESIARDFWGRSNGSPVALRECEAALRGLGLSPSELHALRGELPATRAGTTGERLARVDRLLKRLEHEALA